MRKQKNQDREDSSKQSPLEGSDGQLPIVASARTGLAGKDDAIIRRLPVDYSEETVKDALDYIIETDLKDSELPLAESLKKELDSRESVVVVNGKTAKLDDNINKYLVPREHELPDGSTSQYRELEIEVAAVQQGGLYSLLR